MKSCCLEGRVRLCAHHAKLLCLLLMHLSVPRLLLSVVSFLSCASSIDVSVARWCCSDSACNFFSLLCQY
jgi:hypothetical protein